MTVDMQHSEDTEGQPVQRNDQALIDVTMSACAPSILEDGKVHALIVPAGGGVAVIDRDGDDARRRAGLNPATTRAATTTVRDAQGLIELVKRWADEESTVVYADPTHTAVTAVLNDDLNNQALGWRDRRVSLALVHTPEWLAWTTSAGRMWSQQEYAEFIEEHLDDIRTPPAADMLELAQSLEANVGVAFASGVRLSDGQRQFTYREDTNASAGRNGQLTIPETFEIGLALWAGSNATPLVVECRLRYRISGEGLRLGHVLHNQDSIVRSAFESEVVGPIANAGLTVVHGTP